MSALAEGGIRLPHEHPGKHRLPCPQCEKGRSDDALEVTVTPRRWTFWKCYRCGLEGRAPLDEGAHHHREPRHLRLEAPPETPRPNELTAGAKRLLAGCKPITKSSPAADYLAIRGCTTPDNDVLWHPALRHRSGHIGPAIVAIVTDIVTGERINLHRTWIKPDGAGKAEIEKPRLLLKHHRAHGGVIRLFPDEAVTTGLCIAEGLETTLSAAHGFTPAWATLDAGNLATFPVLDGIECLTVAVDHDRAGLAAFNTVAARWLAAGREVRQWLPPDYGADINDWAGAAA
jgi:hypothetical protein